MSILVNVAELLDARGRPHPESVEVAFRRHLARLGLSVTDCRRTGSTRAAATSSDRHLYEGWRIHSWTARAATASRAASCTWLSSCALLDR